MIAMELNSDSDTDLLTKCAQFFMQKQHFEKAVGLLAVAKKVSNVITVKINICSVILLY